MPIDAVDRAFEVMRGSSVALRVLGEHHIRVLHARFGGADFGVIRVGLDMLLQILRALESLTTEVTFVRLKWHMDADVRGYMITLDCCGVASAPLAGQVEVVGAFTSNVALANMFLYELSLVCYQIGID